MARQRLEPVLGAVLLAAAVLVGFLASSRPGLGAVYFTIGEERMPLAEVSVGWASVVLLVWVGAARLLRVRGTLRRVESGIAVPVQVFSIALLNGVDEVGALVPVYALATVPALLSVVQRRTQVVDGHRMLPMIVAAAVGIVPWGVIAFYQIGAGVIGSPPDATTRVATLVMLGLTIALFVAHWREAAHAKRDGSSHALLSSAAVLAFAAFAIAVG
jgi:hypothetical protein